MIKGLICTVGLSPSPIVEVVREVSPDFVYFICSKASKKALTEMLGDLKNAIKLREYDFSLVDETSAADVMREVLEAVDWLKKNGLSHMEIALDGTGGTKPMTAGAIMSAALLGLRNLYTSVEYTSDSKIKPETMEVLSLEDPQEIFGAYEAKFAVEQLNLGNYTLAEYIFTRLSERSINLRLRTLLEGLNKLCIGLKFWDRFSHEKAESSIQNGINILSILIKDKRSRELEKLIKKFDLLQLDWYYF